MISAGFSGRDFFMPWIVKAICILRLMGKDFWEEVPFLGKDYFRRVYFCTRI